MDEKIDLKKLTEDYDIVLRPKVKEETKEEIIETKPTEKKEEEEKEPIDWAIVGAVSVILICVCFVAFVVGFVIVAHENAPYYRACREDQKLLYAVECNGEEDCLEKCFNFLKEKAKEES